MEGGNNLKTLQQFALTKIFLAVLLNHCSCIRAEFRPLWRVEDSLCNGKTKCKSL